MERGPGVLPRKILKKMLYLLAHFGDMLSGDHYHIHRKRVYKCSDHYRIRASLESNPILAGPTGLVPPALAWR